MEQPEPTTSLLQQLAASISTEKLTVERERLTRELQGLEASYQEARQRLERELNLWDHLLPLIQRTRPTAEFGTPDVALSVSPTSVPSALQGSATAGAPAEPDQRMQIGGEESVSRPPKLADVIVDIARATPNKVRWRGSELAHEIRKRGLLAGRTHSSVNMALRRLEQKGVFMRDPNGAYVLRAPGVDTDPGQGPRASLQVHLRTGESIRFDDGEG